MIQFVKVLTSKAHAANRCVEKPYGCGEEIHGFTSSQSQREYLISALCQKCQDKLWAKTLEDFLEVEDQIAYNEYLAEKALRELQELNANVV